MLHEIRIRDLGIIDDSVIEFGPGLTVLSGETGAGKTMVVSSLALLLGARSDASLVRDGASKAVIEGVFVVPDAHPAVARATEAGGDVDDALVVVRTVSSEGRSRAHVGGRAAPVSVLSELGEGLVAVHGQADQWRLRQPSAHRDLLDAFGGERILGARTAYEEAYAAHAQTESDLQTLRAQSKERAQELDLLTRGLERIAEIDPRGGEDDELRIESERLTHAHELREAVGNAHTILAGDDDAAVGGADAVMAAVARARAELGHVSDNDPAVAELENRLVDISHQFSELAADVSRYLADLDVDPTRLQWVQERRAALASLTRSYGDTIEDVLAWSQRASAAILELEGTDDRIESLETQRAQWESARAQRAAALTKARSRAAKELSARISDELTHLAMGSATVEVTVTQAGQFGPTGRDEVEIGLAANTGAAVRSVSKVASGGELSRLMLAIEVASAQSTTDIQTFVFDEVDAGVGGQAALDVGARLSELAQTAQVIVVTHLAQVAAYADHHLVVSKSDDGRVTRSGVREVSGADRVAELARMMAGTESDAALEHARTLLDELGTVAKR